MKILARRTISQFEIEVVVDFELDEEYIQSAKIRPVMTKDGQIDGQALSDYLAFIEQAESELEDVGLVIIDESDSRSSETSKYFTLADKKQYENDSMKYVIFLRISDHVPDYTEEQKRWIRQKRDDTKSKLKVKWKVRRILVNNEEFDDYDDAAEYVAKKAEEYIGTLNQR